MSEDLSGSKVVVHVCTTCRPEGATEEVRAGARLYQSLKRARTDDDPLVETVECLSVCRRPCTISFSAPGSWTYVYGDFRPDADPESILAAARLYARSPKGLIPWRERPEMLKKGVIARVPPFALSTEKAS